ncbi:hypothetical protein PO878_07555 [Iamia majanohamensis]|uniref:Uncharacterized protein n=1 Tax=Iamia majanohamensis TaxID=467976 RepID=A0AAE9YCB0_9ACTN|nr:hypothetical protein [Iamia majanohamensis]WCO68583.1 hypothetical protein PO878_07555 [Iamia majanohamensis]
MAPTPTHLRAAADGLRRIARRLDVDLEPLPARGDHRTWEGPAATSHRRAAADAGARARQATADLRTVAAGLDARADAVERAEAAAAEAARLEAERRAADRLEGRRPPEPSGRPAPPTLRPDAPFALVGEMGRG